MKLNATHVAERLTGVSDRGSGISVDLTVMKINEILGNPRLYSSGMNGVTSLPAEMTEGFYELEPYKAYEVVFNEGLKRLPSNECATIIQRRTLNSCGVLLQSCIYEPDFECEHLVATLYTSHLSFFCSRGTALAKIMIETTEDSDA